LNNKTWDGYKEFYQSKKTSGRWGKSSNGLSAETINSDISTLQSFLSWCVYKGYVSHTEIPQKIKKVKQRKQHTEETIPAFYPDDWKIIVDVLENWDLNGIDWNNHRGIEDSMKEWRQELFRWWVCFQYETGCRPHETDKLRFRDVEVFKDELGNEKLLISIPLDTKTGGREVVAPYYLLEGLLRHKRVGIVMLEKKNQEHNRRVKERWEKGVKRKSDVLKDEFLYDHQKFPEPDDLLFWNVFSQKGKRTTYSTTWYEEQWEAVLRQAMKNPKFPQDAIHKFPMYSLRATHITHELLRDVDIEKLAMNVGNSPPVIRSRYRRPMQRLNAKYLANATGALQEFDDDDVMESLHN
jgi:integrase